MIKVLVTGGAGFLGSHLVDQLIIQGYEVIVVDNFVSGKAENVHVKAKLCCCDIRDGRLKDYFEQFKPEIVFHLASRTKYNEKIMSSKGDALSNIDNDLSATLNVLDACVKTGVEKVIFASTIEVYGDANGNTVTEDHPKQPRSYHGRAKIKQERYFELFKDNYDLDYTILRFSNIYGTRQQFSGESRVFSLLQHCIEKHIPLMIRPSDQLIRDCIYIEDAVAACITAMKTGGNTYYNIGMGIPVSANELIGCLELLLKKKASFHPGMRYKTRQRSVCFDISKAIEELGWRPTYSLSLGLADFIKNQDSAYEHWKSTS